MRTLIFHELFECIARGLRTPFSGKIFHCEPPIAQQLRCAELSQGHCTDPIAQTPSSKLAWPLNDEVGRPPVALHLSRTHTRAALPAVPHFPPALSLLLCCCHAAVAVREVLCAASQGL